MVMTDNGGQFVFVVIHEKKNLTLRIKSLNIGYTSNIQCTISVLKLIIMMMIPQFCDYNTSELYTLSG
jgi:hypothetical protein